MSWVASSSSPSTRKFADFLPCIAPYNRLLAMADELGGFQRIVCYIKALRVDNLAITASVPAGCWPWRMSWAASSASCCASTHTTSRIRQCAKDFEWLFECVFLLRTEAQRAALPCALWGSYAGRHACLLWLPFPVGDCCQVAVVTLPSSSRMPAR